jgi:hypothetical protein
LIANDDETARETLVRYQLTNLLRTPPEQRHINEDVRTKLDEVRGRLRATDRLRWIRLFEQPNQREKVNLGTELLSAWIGLFDGLLHFAESPQQWTQADEADLEARRDALVQARNRWRDVPANK